MDAVNEPTGGLDRLVRMIDRYDCARANPIVRHGLQIISIRQDPPQADIEMRFRACQGAELRANALMRLGCPARPFMDQGLGSVKHGK